LKAITTFPRCSTISSLCKVSFVNCCAGGKIENNEMGGACSADGGGKRCAQGSGGETSGKETIGETQT